MLVRFGVSLDGELLQKLDELIGRKGYTNRSEALRDMIRQSLVQEEWSQGREVVGAIILVYDHHRRELVNRLTDLQHDFGELIISSQHIHIDHNNCLEIVAVKGDPRKIEDLANRLRAIKGVKHGNLSLGTTGKHIR